MKEKFETMMNMQDSFNKIVNKDWKNAGYEWGDAISVEAVELLDHYGWKWWKKQTPDIDQCKMELIDIWHFIMSAIMVSGATTEELSIELDLIANNQTEFISDSTHVKNRIRMLIKDGASGTIDEATVVIFFELLTEFSITGDELFNLYVGKNTLNKFRQDNGYKTGTYVKIWNGMEDNVYLMEIISSLNSRKINPSKLAEEIYAELTQVYSKVDK